jgi:hypothetical protein
LLPAAQAKREHDWEQTSWLAAWLTNIKLPKGKKPIQPRDINPLTQPQKKKKKKIEVGEVVSHLMPPELAAKYAELAKAKADAKATGDFTKFNEMAAKFKC